MAGTTASIGNFHIYRDGTEDGFYGFSPGCPVLVRQRYYGPDPIELRACIFSHDVALDFSTRQLPLPWVRYDSLACCVESKIFSTSVGSSISPIRAYFPGLSEHLRFEAPADVSLPYLITKVPQSISFEPRE